jgi:hypothetical protein
MVIALTVVSLPASAQQQFVYPQKGQSAEQQQRDQGECHIWAVQQSGFDPATASPGVTTSQPKGSALRGALGGAAVGAIAGEIIDDDAGKGAAIGAGTGALFGGVRRRRSQQQINSQQQQQQAAFSQQQSNYRRANSACLQGRGYTVQ